MNLSTFLSKIGFLPRLWSRKEKKPYNVVVNIYGGQNEISLRDEAHRSGGEPLPPKKDDTKKVTQVAPPPDVVQ